MCLAASLELAKVAENKGLRDDYIIPNMDEVEVFPSEAAAVGMMAIEQKVARLKLSREELYQMADRQIKEAREQIHQLMDSGNIPAAPEGV
jgi:malate dehydrogenase (oxaloacetate-decarboxylating)